LGTLLAWNNDPEILRYTEGDGVIGYDLADVQQIYRGVSQNAYCFMAEIERRPFGECWLQHMNVERIVKQHQNEDCRRIDLMIGDKRYWRRGFGTEMIGLLTAFAFTWERADVIFGCEIADYNVASIRAFQKAGYTVVAKIKQPAESCAKYRGDLATKR
jgi:RimJ/RimL family protein N-acetyltransferase